MRLRGFLSSALALGLALVAKASPATAGASSSNVPPNFAPSFRVVSLPVSPPRYGEPPPSWLAARGLVPGSTQRLGVLPDGHGHEGGSPGSATGPGTLPPVPLAPLTLTLRDPAQGRAVVLGTLRPVARRAGSQLLAEGEVTVPAWPDGSYQLSVDGKELAEGKNPPVPVVLSSAYAAALRAASRSLEVARQAAHRLGDVARNVSLPSVEMLLEDAEAVWNDLTDIERDLRFVLANLENARSFADQLARGDDPYLGLTGILYKAYRSEADGTLQPYGLRVPDKKNVVAAGAADASKGRLPLLIDLHGAWANHRLDMRRIFGRSNRPGESDHEASRNVLPMPEVDMLVATVYGRGEFFGYDGLGEADVLRVLADVRKAYPVDAERIYLTGYSMGGGGTWSIGLRHPDLFAALVPVCAPVHGVAFQKRNAPMQVLDDAAVHALTSAEALADNALGMRVIFFHGDQDPAVPVANSRAMAERFRALGYLGKNVTYHELPGVGHAAWEVAYGEGRIFRELAGVKREAFPRRVHLRAYSPRYGENAWLRIDALAQGGQHAVVDGTQDGRGAFTVSTQNVRGLTVRWDEGSLKPHAPMTVTLDGAPVFAGAAPSPLFFERAAQGWRRVQAAVSHPVPDHPACSLFGKSLPRSAAHLYVYGTAGSSEMTQASRTLAETLADFGEGTKFHATVQSDVEVEASLGPAELARRDVVLVGGPRNNRLAARWAAAWPVRDDGKQLTAGSLRLEDPDRSYRLVFPRPEAPGRLVLVLGAETTRGLAQLRRWLVDEGPVSSRMPETNTDFLVLDGRGQAIKVGAFRDDWTIP